MLSGLSHLTQPQMIDPSRRDFGLEVSSSNIRSLPPSVQNSYARVAQTCTQKRLSRQ